MHLLDGFRWRGDLGGLGAENFLPSGGETDIATDAKVRPGEGLRPAALLPWALLVIGISLSIFLAIAVEDSLDNVARLRFERQTSEAKAQIEDRLHSYANILYGLKAHFASLNQVNRLQFHRVVESLDLPHRYPGFDTVNYAVYVALKDKEKFERSVRSDRSLDPRGYPGFAINPPGIRPEYYVIAYVEPMSGFEFSFGLDISANPETPDTRPILWALQLQRDTGKLYTSGVPLKLLSSKNSVGLAMRLAVYRTGMPVDTVEQRRAAYIGSIGAGYRVANLMKDVLPQALVPAMRFRLFDVGSAGGPAGPLPAPRLLYDSNVPAEGSLDSAAAGEVFTRRLPLEIGGRIWQVQFSAPRVLVAEPFERQLPLFVLLAGLLISTLLFGVLYSLASSRGRAIVLANEITKDLHTSNEQLQALSRQLVDLQEAERRHFSRELHDQIGQNLTALSINIDILKTEMSDNAESDHYRRLDNLAALVDSTVGAIENVMSDLRPPMLDDYGLLPALQWYGEEFSKRTGIPVTVRGDENMARLPPTTEIALFRISQEALNNVAKHARAGAVNISLESVDRHCVLTIADNGIGFAGMPAENARRRHGMGMINMRERTQAINGSFEFTPAPGGGSRVVVHAPYLNAD